MPELPDVEIFRRYFEATALHQRISAVKKVSTKLLQGLSSRHLVKNLSSYSFRGAKRHGKYLFARVEDKGWLVLHFGMSGFLKYFQNNKKTPEHIRLLIVFANGSNLAYVCRRKLGRIAWTTDLKHFITECDLGPDVLADNFNEEVFRSLLHNRRGSIKSLLMNQQVLAGIGNIYSDEILYQSGIHPQRQVAQLQKNEQERLYDGIRSVLQTAIDSHVGETGWPDDWLLPVRESGQTCPRCSGEIKKLKVAGRYAYFCEDHQTR